MAAVIAVVIAASFGWFGLQRRRAADATLPAIEPSSASWRAYPGGWVPICGFQGRRVFRLSVSILRRTWPLLTRFLARHSDAALYRFDMPLPGLHRYAYKAAIAANCAELQGVRAPYQSLLFRLQADFAVMDWAGVAGQSGVSDTAAFEACLRDEVPRDRVDSDLKVAGSLGIEGTPSFLINGTYLVQPITEGQLELQYWKWEHHGVWRLWGLLSD